MHVIKGQIVLNRVPKLIIFHQKYYTDFTRKNNKNFTKK